MSVRARIVAAAALVSVACLTSPTEFSDPSVPIRVKPGEEFVIVLESNASTGFAWRLAAPTDEKVVRFLRSRYEAPSGSGVVGAGGKEYWSFVAAAAGSTTIRLEYVRSFQSVPGPTTYTFTVEVQ